MLSGWQEALPLVQAEEALVRQTSLGGCCGTAGTEASLGALHEAEIP